MGRFVTIEGRRVFIGGPPSGAGKASAESVHQVAPGTPWEFPRDQRRIPQSAEDRPPSNFVFTGWAGWVDMSKYKL